MNGDRQAAAGLIVLAILVALLIGLLGVAFMVARELLTLAVTWS